MKFERDIFINDTRIFTPMDLYKFSSIIGTSNGLTMFYYYFSTGIRHSEGNYILDNPADFDVKNRVIHFKPVEEWDKRNLFKPRDIYLSYHDLIHVLYFINANTRVNIKILGLSHYMKYWAKKLNLPPNGINALSLRKTRFVWLLNTFPEYEDVILKSMNHLPCLCTNGKRKVGSDEAIDYYKDIKFTKDEQKYIYAHLIGWDDAVEKSL